MHTRPEGCGSLCVTIGGVQRLAASTNVGGLGGASANPSRVVQVAQYGADRHWAAAVP